MGAHRDTDAQKRYWLGHERLAQRLVEKCDVTVAEAHTGENKVIVGYVIHEGDSIVHYVLTRRKFQKMGVCRDLLSPFMHGGQVLYSHRPSVKGLKIPDGWKYDPYVALKWLL